MTQPVTHSEDFHGAIKIESCNKTTFRDKRAVQSFLNKFKRSRGRHGRPEWLRPYWCGDCGGWHVTKGKPRVGVKKR